MTEVQPWIVWPSIQVAKTQTLMAINTTSNTIPIKAIMRIGRTDRGDAVDGEDHHFRQRISGLAVPSGKPVERDRRRLEAMLNDMPAQKHASLPEQRKGT